MMPDMQYGQTRDQLIDRIEQLEANIEVLDNDNAILMWRIEGATRERDAFLEYIKLNNFPLPMPDQLETLMEKNNE
jgi:hypothetical protein